jgi:hypothetical protein
MKQFSTLLFLLLFQICAAQKEDNTWILGYNSRFEATSTILGDTFGNVKMKFNPSGISLQEDDKLKMDFDGQNASICDKQGNFLFCVDGISMTDAKGKILPNGDSLFTSFLPQTAMILPQPGFDEKYYYVLLAEADYLVDEKGFVYDLDVVKLYYNIVEWDKSKSVGKVIKRQVLLLKDTLDSKITACRHGNGRDWWILIKEYSTNTCYQFLLTPQGIKLHNKQIIGKKTYAGLGQAVFSPDGKWYANYSAVSIPKINQVIDLYNFDRCSGLLSNHQQLFIDTWAKAGGIAFSPNSQFLYIAGHEVLYQVKVQKPFTIENLNIIDTWDGSFNPFPTTFWMMQLAPDNKIYMNIANGVDLLHVIQEPNKSGVACKFEQKAFNLPVYNITMPNFPYFRLYDWQGSPCDTIGINSPVATEDINQDILLAKLYPNPVSNELEVMIPTAQNSNFEVELQDMTGHVINRQTTFGSTIINMSELSDGVFVCKIYKDNKIIFTQKVVKIH